MPKQLKEVTYADGVFSDALLKELKSIGAAIKCKKYQDWIAAVQQKEM